MRKKLKNTKKGLSDLVSNVLIIMLVILIAVIFFSWAYNYYKEMQEQKELDAQKQLACANIYFSVKNVCSTKNRIEITLENQASDNIFELVYRLKNNKDVVDTGVATRELGAYSTKKYLFGYISNVIPNAIELFPTIKINEMLVTCDNLLRAQDIKICVGYEVKAGEESKCGNNNIDPGEDCDGSNLNGYSCSDFGNYDSGSLYCKDCGVVLIGCRKSSGGGTPTPACVDADGDGFTASSCGGTDCDDTNQYIYPENTNIYCECPPSPATEILGNGIDENCDGSDLIC